MALQDKLARCVRQLGDWQACPSGKTPEGKQIIQNLQSQIRNIESRIAGTTHGAAAPSATASPSQRPDSIGSLLNVFA